MSTPDYYKILEVEPTASDQEIKKSYRRLAMIHHPDSSSAGTYKEEFYQVQEAYNFLSNAERRRLYDEKRSLDVTESPWETEDPLRARYVSKEEVANKLEKANKQNISQIQSILKRHATSESMNVELSGLKFRAKKGTKSEYKNEKSFIKKLFG